MSISKSYILACQISGVYDVNRNEILPADDFALIQNWYYSIINLKLNGIIFHNNFSTETCQNYENEYIKFIKIDFENKFNPNVFRYHIYSEFLKNNTLDIENLFFTDISDVVVLKNPFEQKLFRANQNHIFCGDEPEILANNWMIDHCEHLRNKIQDFKRFENQYKNQTLLNCGVFGGNIKIIKPFVEQLWQIHQENNFDNYTKFTGDMGAFNYLIRSKYNNFLLHGAPINTVFKAYDIHNEQCWFSHK